MSQAREDEMCWEKTLAHSSEVFISQKLSLLFEFRGWIIFPSRKLGALLQSATTHPLLFFLLHFTFLVGKLTSGSPLGCRIGKVNNPRKDDHTNGNIFSSDRSSIHRPFPNYHIFNPLVLLCTCNLDFQKNTKIKL